MILLLASLLLLRSAAAADVGYFWHVSDFHLDPRYGSNVTRAGARDIFLGDYDEVSVCNPSIFVIYFYWQGCWTERRHSMGDYNCDSPLTLVQAAADVMDGNTLIIKNATMLVMF